MDGNKAPAGTDARNKVVAARAGLVLEHPFFGHLALRMHLREDRNCDTAWSDGKTLAYNPFYVRMLPPAKLMGLMAHVVMHPACRHHLRRNGREHKLWNMACDYAINWILLEAGLVLPDGFLDDPKLRGRTADEIYARLERDRDKTSAKDQNQKAATQVPGEGEDAEMPEDAGVGHRNRRAGDDTNLEKDDRDSAGEAAAADDGDACSFEETYGDPGGTGEVRDAPPPASGSAASGEDMADESEWRLQLAQAASAARSMGDLPASLVRLVDGMVHPRLDWRRLLHRFIQMAARSDYSWSPPNRRHVHRGLYLPGMRSDDLPEAVVAVDTSGSVSAGELEQFAAELSAILQDCIQSVHLLYCDSRVARTETVHRQDLPLSLAPPGGGGTDFRPAFEWVDARGITPLCLIYLTDLACTRFPSEEPPYPVLWACVGDEDVRPPFGETVLVQ